MINFDRGGLLHVYHSNRKQRVQIGTTFSDWRCLINYATGLNSSSSTILCIFNNLIFCIEKSEICNFAGDNTLYASGENVGDVVTYLEVDMENVIKWFDSNYMIANPEITGDVPWATISSNICIEIYDLVLVPKDNVKLLGINIDSLLLVGAKE